MKLYKRLLYKLLQITLKLRVKMNILKQVTVVTAIYIKVIVENKYYL